VTIETFEYSLAILLWVGVISLLMQWISFYWSYHKKTHAFLSKVQLPSVLLAPLAIVFCFKFFKINLIAGIQSDMNFFEFAGGVFAPAVVLVFASGLASRIFSETFSNLKSWNEMGFVKFAHASGKNVPREIFALTCTKSYAEAFTFCIPTLFAELIVVEALFNCYGIGYQVLSSLREQRFYEALIFSSILILSALICLTLSWTVSKWIGEKLESYS